MAIIIPKALEEIYQREFMDMYTFREESIVDDMSGFIFDHTKGQMENSFLITTERVKGAMQFLPDALKGPIQEILRIKQEAMDRCFIRETEPDFEQKRYEGVLSRIATFSGSEKEKKAAVTELDRLGKPVSNDLLEIVCIDEILPVLTGIVDPNIIHIDEISDELKKYGLDITPYLPDIGVKFPDKIVYDGAPLATANYPITNTTRPNTASVLSDKDKARLASFDQTDGLFRKTFESQINNLPDGVNIFDTIFVNGQSFSDLYAAKVKGLSPTRRENLLKIYFANTLFEGTTKVEFCPIDKDYNVGQPIRVSAGKNVFTADPPRPMSALRKFFVNRGFFKEYVNREYRQDKLFKESNRSKVARHSALKQKLQEKAAKAKQAKEAAVEAEYTVLLQKAKAASLEHTKSVDFQYSQYFKKEDKPILEAANEKMGLRTLSRDASALSFARIALMAKGHSLSDILNPTALVAEKAQIGTELIEKINEGDQEYFRDMFKEAGLRFKDFIVPQEISTREELIKSYASLMDLKNLAIDYQQIKLSTDVTDYDSNLTPTEKEEIGKNSDKLGAIAKITSAYTESLISVENNPAPHLFVNSAVTAAIALNLPLKPDIRHPSYKIGDVDIPEGYKGIGNIASMEILNMQEAQKNKIINECVAFAKSDKNKSPIFIDGEYMPVIRDTHQRISILPPAPRKEEQAQARRRVSLDLGTTKAHNLTNDPKTAAVAPKQELNQTKK